MTFYDAWARPTTHEPAGEGWGPYTETWDFAIQADSTLEVYRALVAWFEQNPHLQSGYEELMPHRMTECSATYAYIGCPHPATENSPRHLWHIRRQVTDLTKIPAPLGQIGLGL